jgi:tripartite-type tricarboxylate transporter receptor subunit TctC
MSLEMTKMAMQVDIAEFIQAMIGDKNMNNKTTFNLSIKTCVMALGAISLTLSGAFSASHAQATWPTKSIRVVVPFAPGSFTDTAARTVGAELSKQLGQTVVVENKGGAGSTLGTDIVAKSAPDGYTFLVTDNSFAVSAALYAKLPYQPKEIAQVSLLAEGPAVLVGRPTLPTQTLKETIAFAQANPGKLTFGSGGQGSSAHLAMEAFLMQNNAQLVHVPFKGIAAAMVDVAAGRLDIAIGSAGSTSAHIKNNRLLGLAVSGEKRHPNMPNVPTFAEAGFPGYKMMYWFGMMAPAGTPAPVMARMQKEISIAVASPKVQSVFNTAGVMPVSTTSAVFTELVQSEIKLWKDVIVRAKIKVE